MKLGRCTYNHVNANNYNYVVSSELLSSGRIGQKGKKDQRPSSNLGLTLYRGVSATRAIDPSRDPPSPITLKYGHGCAAIQRPLKTRALRLVYTVCSVVVAGSAAPSMLHGIREPEMEAASFSLCVSLSNS